MVRREDKQIGILIAASIYPPDPGGPAVHAKAQFEGFERLGFETGLVALSHYRKWPRGVRHFLYFLKIVSMVRRYDVVYAHDTVGAGLPALVAAKLFNKKLVVRVGGDRAWERHAEAEDISLQEWYSKGMYRKDKIFLLSRFFLKRADLIVVIGKSLANLYERYYGIERKKIKVILNPIPKPEESLLAEQEQTIIFASRLVDYKNLDLVLRVLAQVVSEHKDLKFLIMGTGPAENNLKNFVSELGIEKNVLFMNQAHQSEVLKRTASCLFTVAPALTEFNPNYVLQGIGFDKPFLVSRENDFPFSVPEYLMFNPRDEGELRDRILYLLTPEGYEKAKDFVTSISLNMSWDDNLRENAEAIESLFKGLK